MTTPSLHIKRTPVPKRKGDKVVVRSAVSGEFLHKEMKAFTAKISKDPEAALGFLKRAGIVTPTGKIAKAYGG